MIVQPVDERFRSASLVYQHWPEQCTYQGLFKVRYQLDAAESMYSPPPHKSATTCLRSLSNVKEQK